MRLLDALQNHDFPENVIEIVTSSGIKNLYPPQADAVNKGLLKNKSLLMSVPTASGKTLMAELCMLNSIIKDGGRCLYIAPLKALASEKFKDFKNKYESLGIQVGIAIGDSDTPTKNLNEFQIIIATAEKVDSLLRSKAKWLIDGLSVVVLDEIHFINDGSRGPTMEILTARIKQINPKIQFLALSATVSNAAEMAGWLEAELVVSDWRPIPLKEGVYYNEQIVFEEHGTRNIVEEAPDDVSKLTLDTLRGKGQVLIFVNSRRSAQAVSRQVCSSVAKVLTVEEKQQLLALSKKIAGGRADETKICRKLADVIANGSAFHHAGLKPNQRELIEEHFKKNLIKVIGCTPTLAAGVNLPARRAIVRDCKRFESGLGQAYIPTSEYKQCAGRAGRPQYDEYGEAVLVAKTNSESSTLFERYIEADPEPVMSKLGSESALRIHILASIAGGYVHDVKGMIEFIEHTFLHYQKIEPNLLEFITDIFDFLNREGFVDKSGYRFFATPLGSLTSRLYIDPITAITLREGLNLINSEHPYSNIGMLHLITCCPDSVTMKNVGKKILEELETFASHFQNEFLMTPDNCAMIDDYYPYLSTIKTTWMLNQWIEEDRDEEICDKFECGPGDVYRYVESARWLLYAAGTISDLYRKKKLTFQIDDLRKRVQYGVKEDALELVQLKGVGRVRARILHSQGFKKLADFKFSAEEDIASLKGIGKTLAKEIFEQIRKGTYKKAYSRQ